MRELAQSSEMGAVMLHPTAHSIKERPTANGP